MPGYTKNNISFTRVMGFCYLLFFVLMNGNALAQDVQAKDTRYIRIGSLQSHFTAYGSERAWNNSYYEGLRWPAEYPYSDNAVIKFMWVGCQDFTDAYGDDWENYALYFGADFVGSSLFPVELHQSAKYEIPKVYVDGNDLNAIYAPDVDEINPDQVPDRIVTNVVNTSMGLTMTRRVYAFGQEYHDNYFIKEFIFKNTGNTDYDNEIELETPLKGVRVGYKERYSVSREGSFRIGGGQSWGQHSWVSRRGENYPDHYGESIDPNNPIVEWLRCAFTWAGQNVNNSFDNIGGPYVARDGRLCAPQFAGIAVLHVDKSANDKADDPYQPSRLGWHAGDIPPNAQLGDMTDPAPMKVIYRWLEGNAWERQGGTDRFDETNLNSITHRLDPSSVHGNRAGTNIWIQYGPFDLDHGDSVRIVEVEGISGLDRTTCENVGRLWKKAYTDPTFDGPFEMPDGSDVTGNDKLDEFKNKWVYTGKDSILLTFSRAKRNFDMNFEIPQPPLPPPIFEVISGGDKITLKWNPSPSENEPDFRGYKIFRAIGKPDTVHQQVFACGAGTENPAIVHQYDDVNAVRGLSYYYYIVAFNSGENNNTAANPSGPLHSSKYVTRTTEPAYLTRQSGTSLQNIRIVPNPYYIKARNLQFPEEIDKIMFYNIPGHCDIKIYTERGDLIKTIHHRDGSGDEAWNSVTDYRQVVVSGVYIAHIKVTKDIYDRVTGKLILSKGDSINKKIIIIR